MSEGRERGAPPFSEGSRSPLPPRIREAPSPAEGGGLRVPPWRPSLRWPPCQIRSDRPALVLRKPLGDAAHHARRPRIRSILPHRCRDRRLRHAVDRAHRGPGRMTAGAGLGSRRRPNLGRRRRQQRSRDEKRDDDSSPLHARRRSVFFNGIWRTRFPVAAKTALSTAGAATAIVGSPTPPQNPPDGITIVSTTGISSIRITG